MEVNSRTRWLETTRNRAFWVAAAGLYGIGLFLVGNPQVFRKAEQHVWLSLSAFAALGLAVVMRQWRRVVAAWVLVIGLWSISVAAATWGGFQEAMWLLLIPVGAAALSVHISWGIAVAVVTSLVLWFMPPTLLSAPPTIRGVALLGIWSSLGFIVATVDALLSPLHWAWSNYQQNLIRLQQAQDKQVQLHQMTTDLAEANLHLNQLHRLAQALRQTAEDERAAKERFVANVSHELRTPLNMVIGFCDMITSTPEMYGRSIPPALLADLNVVLRNSQHLSSLIDDVLDISQIEMGRMALTKERASLVEIVNAAVIAVKPLFESKGLYLKYDIPPDLPLLLCDRTRIREVLLNLLSNAGRFTEHGGVKIHGHQDGRTIVVRVTDTGPGITAEQQGRLFRPFEQLDGSIRRLHGGTGLGLSISKSFVELHDGRMWVESEVGQGTSFFFSLPIDPPALPESDALRWFNPYESYEDRAHPRRINAVAFKPRLVVVEQGETLQRLLGRYLDNAELAPVTTLEQAFVELAETPAQLLVINDLRIGETLERVREAGALPFGVPAIVCTLPGVCQSPDERGVFDYLVKPITRPALLACLERLPQPVRKILLVDDEPDALQLFGRMLNEAGRDYQVMRAANGVQAWEILRQERPDVLLLDLVMPEMDGFQLLALKSQDTNLADIPVVLISARDPLGQPIISHGLAVTCRRGMSAHEIVTCIDALSRILASASVRADRALTTTVPD